MRFCSSRYLIMSLHSVNLYCKLDWVRNIIYGRGEISQWLQITLWNVILTWKWDIKETDSWVIFEENCDRNASLPPSVYTVSHCVMFLPVLLRVETLVSWLNTLRSIYISALFDSEMSFSGSWHYQATCILLCSHFKTVKKYQWWNTRAGISEGTVTDIIC